MLELIFQLKYIDNNEQFSERFVSKSYILNKKTKL